jgi:hypothetical protein
MRVCQFRHFGRWTSGSRNLLMILPIRRTCTPILQGLLVVSNITSQARAMRAIARERGDESENSEGGYQPRHFAIG